MTRVEMFWEDITVYYVEFISCNKKNEFRKFERVFAFREDINEEEVSYRIKLHLDNIVEVTSVDVIYEALLFKKAIFME